MTSVYSIYSNHYYIIIEKTFMPGILWTSSHLTVCFLVVKSSNPSIFCLLNRSQYHFHWFQENFIIFINFNFTLFLQYHIVELNKQKSWNEDIKGTLSCFHFALSQVDLCTFLPSLHTQRNLRQVPWVHCSSTVSIQSWNNPNSINNLKLELDTVNLSNFCTC